ncbi:MAG: dienelactone hydrolase family protein [Clostridia bacterium]|nr:dienelactone hydrolase family protein [Clostridia bacterium]
MMKHKISAVLLCVFLALTFVLSVSAVDLRGVMDAMQYPENPAADAETPALLYRIYLPASVEKHIETIEATEETPAARNTTYTAPAGETYGLLLWLHDEDLRGDDNTAHIADDLKNGLINAFLNNAERSGQYIIIAPQCPAGTKWTDQNGALLDQITAFVTDFCAKNPIIDTGRILVGGISMGAEAGYAMIAKQGTAGALPFAAAFLVSGTCGDNWEQNKSAFQKTDIYAFVSDSDNLYSDEKVVSMAEAVNADGGHVSIARYADMGHEIWGQAFLEDAYIKQFMDTNAPAPKPVETEPVETEPVETEPAVTEAPAPVETEAPAETEAQENPQKIPSLGGIEITPALIAYVILAAACVIAVIMLISGLTKHNRNH